MSVYEAICLFWAVAALYMLISINSGAIYMYEELVAIRKAIEAQKDKKPQ